MCKTFAEKAAWDFVKNEKPNFDLAVINPPFVFGPVIGYLNSLDNLNTSNEKIRDFAQGKYKDDTNPTENSLWVDVRDVALAHVKAIEVAEAGGQRFFTAEGFFSHQGLAEVIRETHPKYAANLPDYGSKKEITHLFDFDASRATKVLGVKYTSFKKSTSDTLTSLIKVGL
jgi:nucleoside-diphosphate-sugar epimerase